jgi:hypothetical protein
VLEEPKSLYIFHKENRIRQFCIKITNSKYFDLFIIIVIIVNSILLGIYDYENQDSSSVRNEIVNYAEPFFIFVFTLEAALKIIAIGFVINKNTYLRDSWN